MPESDVGLDDSSRIEAEIRLPGILLEVGSYDWDPLIETTQCLREHTVSMLLSPRHRTSQGCYAPATTNVPFFDIGDLLLVPAGLPFKTRSSGGPVRFVRCRYQPDRFRALTGLSDQWTPEVLKACLDIRDARLHEAMMRLGHEALAPGFQAEALAEGLAMAVAVDLARHIRALEPEPEIFAGGLAPWQLRRITAYVASHPGVKADMAELAALCGISGRHLRRLFKQTTRQTLQDYIRDSWVAQTKSLLCDTDLPLKEIASRMGFSEPGGFSMAFRRATGAAPRSFRQQFAKGGFVAKLDVRPARGR
jgi:AraC family transcriptional regulator